jgi:hypothetical protein
MTGKGDRTPISPSTSRQTCQRIRTLVYPHHLHDISLVSKIPAAEKKSSCQQILFLIKRRGKKLRNTNLEQKKEV